MASGNQYVYVVELKNTAYLASSVELVTKNLKEAYQAYLSRCSSLESNGFKELDAFNIPRGSFHKYVGYHNRNVRIRSATYHKGTIRQVVAITAWVIKWAK